ncbi:MAG TPA: class I SAM-dependent methyltransferase [Thermoanaerobaculia bacterium]|nr:class I SAM-dependent methyltransferase [Thermoanaerobaculia bacterium]
MSDRYGEDLAWIHHAGFSEFAESAAPGLLDILRRHGIRDGLVIDVGCGSGVWARALTDAGYDVLGIDASPAMIALARRTAPDARFEVGSFATFDFPPCAAITAVGEVFNYGRREQLASFFARVSARLLVFDLAERGSYPPHDERRVGGDDWSVIAVKESDGARLTRRVLTFRRLDGETRRSEEVHELELYDREDVTRLLREARFSVRVRRSYGRRRLPKGHAVYVAARRGPC